MSRESILVDINQERLRQDEKWGLQNHIPIEWIAILGEEFGEASKEALEMHFHPNKDFGKRLMDYRKELVQVAAVAVAMIECVDRNTWMHDLFHRIQKYHESEVTNDKDR